MKEALKHESVIEIVGSSQSQSQVVVSTHSSKHAKNCADQARDLRGQEKKRLAEVERAVPSQSGPLAVPCTAAISVDPSASSNPVRSQAPVTDFEPVTAWNVSLPSYVS
jgi:hypothetical protein